MRSIQGDLASQSAATTFEFDRGPATKPFRRDRNEHRYAVVRTSYRARSTSGSGRARVLLSEAGGSNATSVAGLSLGRRSGRGKLCVLACLNVKEDRSSFLLRRPENDGKGGKKEGVSRTRCSFSFRNMMASATVSEPCGFVSSTRMRFASSDDERSK